MLTSLSLLVSAMGQTPPPALRLPSVFGSHMVVQRDAPLPVWGQGEPGDTIQVSAMGVRRSTKVSSDGTWQVKLPAPRVGLPIEISVSDGETSVDLKDVLVGDIWVCSGQSNMQWSVSASMNAAQELANANQPRLRLLLVPNVGADQPQPDVEAKWTMCTPATAASFSAVGYFFGKALAESEGVPIGLIGTSWGGTPAESWTPRDELISSPVLRPMIKNYEIAKVANRDKIEEYNRLVQLRKARNSDTGIAEPAKDWAAVSTETGDWRTIQLPALIEDLGMAIDGAVWFRKQVEIPAAWAGKPLVLKVGAIDDMDTTYWNGQQVGQTGAETPNAYASPREYKVPAESVAAGSAVIAIRVFDEVGNGGFSGTPDSMILVEPSSGQTLPLAGEWKTKVERAIDPQVTQLPQQPMGPGNPWAPTNLYNAMIHPFVKFPIKGAIWYQGESNAGRYDEYKVLLPAMIKGWRRAWGHDFPFLIVQLANFMERNSTPVDSDWARLREAQVYPTQVLPNTQIAVTVDIGDAADIHPRNKQDVGGRLALAARETVYGSTKMGLSPIYDRMEVKGDRAVVYFRNTYGVMTTVGNASPVGLQIAGDDRVWYWATAETRKNTVVAWSPAVPKPVAVRYAWSNNPPANLINRAGLPASPFRTDDWPKQ